MAGSMLGALQDVNDANAANSDHVNQPDLSFGDLARPGEAAKLLDCLPHLGETGGP